ncbi:MAG: aminotransferase class V-fold PLP-dependent enzyme [Myxococcales bacterium]|nr:aminotransferase class V-fold PLP-dependent enzyme [Myxococcales bacterium]
MGLNFPIYLDHHATTPTDPRVLDAMRPYFTERFGNAASASHVFGWRAEAAVEQARERLAAAIGAHEPREIVFTSGTTESDNLALKGVARAYRTRRDHLITVATEHSAVLESCGALEREGFRVTVLPVGRSGLVDPDDVRRAIGDRTLLVSVMAANSEIGVLQPLAAIGGICRERDVLFHTDAAQAVGKVPVDVEASGVDLLSMCAHKLYGPPGVGALYIRRRRPRIRLEPLFHGGGHEWGHRSGTLPLALIVGFAEAVDLCLHDLEAEAARLRALRDELWTRLQAGLDDLRLNGDPEQRLPGNLNVAFPGAEADAVIASLRDVALSSGSACSSARPEPSHVLRAIGLSEALARASLRFGLGRGNTREEIEWVADQVIAQVREQREKRAGGRPGGGRRRSDG